MFFHNATKFVYLPPHLRESLDSFALDLLICLLAVVLLMGQQFFFSAHFLVQQRIIIVCAYLFIGVDRGCRRRCRGSCSQINGSGIAAVQRKSRYGKCFYWLLYKKAVMVSLKTKGSCLAHPLFPPIWQSRMQIYPYAFSSHGNGLFKNIILCVCVESDPRLTHLCQKLDCILVSSSYW